MVSEPTPTMEPAGGGVADGGGSAIAGPARSTVMAPAAAMPAKSLLSMRIPYVLLVETDLDEWREGRAAPRTGRPSADLAQLHCQSGPGQGNNDGRTSDVLFNKRNPANEVSQVRAALQRLVAPVWAARVRHDSNAL